MQALLEKVRVDRIMNAVAAGTSDQTSDAVDMSANGGYRGALFLIHFGTLTASHVTSAKVQQSSDDAATDAYDDLAGTSSGNLADGDSNKLIVINIHRPAKRYLKVVVDRGTQNAVIDGIDVILYDPITEPTSQSSDVAKSEIHLTPAEGTA